MPSCEGSLNSEISSAVVPCAQSHIDDAPSVHSEEQALFSDAMVNRKHLMFYKLNTMLHPSLCVPPSKLASPNTGTCTYQPVYGE